MSIYDNNLREAFKDYPLEEDVSLTGGQIGLDLAERVMKHCGNNLHAAKEWINSYRDSVLDNTEVAKLEEIVRVALKKFPPLERGETITSRELSRRLREIRDAGYIVEPYSKMSRYEKSRYLKRIKSELWSELLKKDPSLAVKIKQEKQRESDDELFYR